MEWEGLEGGETRGSVRNVLAPTGVVDFLFFFLEGLEVLEVLEVFVLEVFVLEVFEAVDGSRSVRPGRRPSLLFVDRPEDSVVVPIRFAWVGLVGCSRTWSIRTLAILEVVGAVFLVFDCKRCCLSAVFWAEDTTALLLPPSSNRFECFVAVSAYIFDINALHSKSSWVCAATGSGMACRCLVRRRSLAFSSLVLEAGLDHDGFSPR